MRLSDMLQGTDMWAEMAASLEDQAISGLTCDSRRVRPSWLFAALPGGRDHGGAFIGQAVENGAAAILAPDGFPIDVPTTGDGTVILRSDNPRRGYAQLAARFYGRQPAHAVAVTGTNGKTSTVEFLRQIWSALGHEAASLGTLGLRTAAGGREGNLTTPDPADLHADLKSLAEQGVSHIALEASSHGLSQYRLDGVTLKAAGFTNLSRDHLDYHADMKAYLTAKARLFSELLPPDGIAVLNADAPEFDYLNGLCAACCVKVLSYGHKSGELRALSVVPETGGTRLKADILGRKTDILLRPAGTFQADNVLCALGLALACGAEAESAAAALSGLREAPGRMQWAGERPGGAPVYIDYAHTPDALAKALQALRPYAAARLWVVFGCGGDRDAGKRALMGQVAADLADMTVITDDNPRGEDAAAIREAIAEGHGGSEQAGLRIIGDRAEAIAYAIGNSQAGDAVLVAGKGHENYQIIGDKRRYFDDAEAVRTALAGAVES